MNKAYWYKHGFQLRKNISAGLICHWDYGPFNFYIFCTKLWRKVTFLRATVGKSHAPDHFVDFTFSLSEDGA